MDKHSTVFLLGFMASAKTTIGKKLAAKLNCEFIDLDAFIESECKTSINNIFARKGEEFFRQIESESLKKVLHRKAVIALGGGSFDKAENREMIKKSGRSIFLDVEPDILIGRLRQAKHKRPLIAEMNDEDLADFVKNKLAERLPFYREADYTLKANKPTVTELINILEPT